jgi:predicted DsbA family dithiol-disulfide isomerase
MKIEIWSDVVCPWCYIAKRRLDIALNSFEHRDDVEVVYRSFLLDPLSPKGECRDIVEVLTEKNNQAAEEVLQYLGSVEQAAANDGLAYRLTETRTGNTMDAHRLLQLAESKGLAGPAWERFYRAHFVENRSLFDAESLVELATEVGLDPDEVRAVLASDDQYAAEVLSDHKIANQLGANSVPLFVIDRKVGMAGAQPPGVLLGMLQWARENAQPVAAGG